MDYNQFNIDIEDTEIKKETYVDLINKFININPYIGRGCEYHNQMKFYFERYADEHNMKILDIELFTTNVRSTIRTRYFYYPNGFDSTNDVCVMVGNDNIVHIILKRGRYKEPFEMCAKRLQKKTLIQLYKTFVTDIISPQYLFRTYKEYKNKIDDIILNNVYRNKSYIGDLYVKFSIKKYKSPYLFVVEKKSLSFDSNGIARIYNNTYSVRNMKTLIYTFEDLMAYHNSHLGMTMDNESFNDFIKSNNFQLSLDEF